MRTVVVNPADLGSDSGKALVGCADGNHPRAVTRAFLPVVQNWFEELTRLVPVD